MFEPGDVLRVVHDRLMRRPMNVSFIDDLAAGSARPMSGRAVLWLARKQGINSILSLTDEPLSKEFLADGMAFKHVAIRNHSVPTFPQIKECVDYMLSQTAAGKRVLVHCAAGKGRTGTVLAAYLCGRYGVDASKAIRTVREKRPGSIEKNRQESAVEEYWRKAHESGMTG